MSRAKQCNGVRALLSSWRRAAPVAQLRSVPKVRDGSEVLGEIELLIGSSCPLLDIRSDTVDATETSAEAYSVRYRIELAEGADGWVRALILSSKETGSDGRPSAL